MMIQSRSPPPEDDGDYFNILGDAADITGRARRSAPNTLVAIVQPQNAVLYPELRIAENLGVDTTCDIRGDSRLIDLRYCEISELVINEKKYNFQSTKRGIRKRPSNGEQPAGVFAVRLPKFKKGEKIKLLIQFTPEIGDPNSSVRLDIVDRTREMESSDV